MNADAVGSGVISNTFMPASSAAFVVSLFFISSKYAGTVITAPSKGLPKYFSIPAFIYFNAIAVAV